MSTNAPSIEQYYEQIRLALNNFDDLEWLGSQSPLAAPYFLGDLLPPHNLSPQGRGEALRQAMRQAADALWDGTPPASRSGLEDAVNEERREMGNKGQRYAYLLLDLRYFRRYFRPSVYPLATKEADIREYVGVGRGPYFTHLKVARQALGDALLELAQPMVRLERPLRLPHRLIGRDDIARTILGNLTDGKAVALSGPSGVGKTSLSAAVTQQWPNTAVFWYTLRPTLNDQVDSLLFALGAFCRQHGAANLWRQLVADGGQIANRNVAIGHLVADLHALPQRPLLCFDELDGLQSSPEEMTIRQREWIELLDGLRGHCALLFIGQQRVVQADHAYQLDGFNAAQTQMLLQEIGVKPQEKELHALQRYTGGSPRLLQLCLTLTTETDSISELMQRLPERPILHIIFERLWQRLPAAQRAVAQQLAVFNAPAPADAWPNEQHTVLNKLADRRIALFDQLGGVELLPLYRDLIYGDRQRLPAETADQRHLQAAVIRAERAEFTSAAYHLIAAGEEETAVDLWFAERRREMRRGQGPAALHMFSQLSHRRLSPECGEKLALIRAELYDLLGQAGDGLREIEAHTFQTDEERRIEAARLKGRLQYEIGDHDGALSTYENAFTRTARLIEEQAHLSHLRGLVLVRQRALNEAWAAALRANLHARRLMAGVLDEQGDFQAAIDHYLTSKEIAEQLHDPASIARAHYDLAITSARQGNHDDAQRYAQIAIETYQQMGNRFLMEKLNNFLTALYLNMGEFEQVVELGEPSLRFFENAKLTYWASMTASNVAEAYYELGQYGLAEQMARRVLEMEEAHSYPYAMYTMGLVTRAQGRPEQSAAWLEQAGQMARQNDDRYLQAYVWRALGDTLAAQDRAEEARHAYAQALGLFEEMGIESEAAKTRPLLEQ